MNCSGYNTSEFYEILGINAEVVVKGKGFRTQEDIRYLKKSASQRAAGKFRRRFKGGICGMKRKRTENELVEILVNDGWAENSDDALEKIGMLRGKIVETSLGKFVLYSIGTNRKGERAYALDIDRLFTDPERFYGAWEPDNGQPAKD